MQNIKNFYQEKDFNIVDYSVYKLEGIEMALRGPKLENLEQKEYFTCFGSAHTFGRFCEYPYPSLLKDMLGLEVLNLGFGGVGPEWLLQRQDCVTKYINNSKFVVIQIVSARGSSNSLFESVKGGITVVRRSDGEKVNTEKAYNELLESDDRELLSKIVEETRQSWLESYQQLLTKITVPKILFWFSKRQPDYQESYENLIQFWGAFPQLVNLDMVVRLREYTDDYVECVSTKGLPQALINRFTGEPATLNTETQNNYYPSPEMHKEAAGVLEKVCRKYVEEVDTERNFQAIDSETIDFKLQQQSEATIQAGVTYTGEEAIHKYFADGLALQKKGQLDEAIEAYQKVIELDSKFYEAYCHLGDIFIKQNNVEVAIDCFIKAIQIQSESLKAPQRLLNMLRHNSVRYITPEKLKYACQEIEVILNDSSKKDDLSDRITWLLYRCLLFLKIRQGEYDDAIDLTQKLTKNETQKSNPNFVEQYWQNDNPRKPDFMIIGVMKCGTTSLYDYTGKNPNVLPTMIKEINFFSTEELWQAGVNWYKANFPPIPDNSGYVTGEASPRYFPNLVVARKIRELFPNIKLIVILRNPVERFISHFYMNQRNFGEFNKSLKNTVNWQVKQLSALNIIEEKIESGQGYGILIQGLYIYFLEKWMSIFPKEQFSILTLEDLTSNSSSVMKEVFSFLEVPNHEIKIFEKKNSGSRPDVSDEIRQTLSDFYKPHNQKLEEFLGKKLNWDVVRENSDSNRSLTALSKSNRKSMQGEKIHINNNYSRPYKSIVHCTYHKVATTFFLQILKRIAQTFNWNFQVSFIEPELMAETDIFLQHNSRIDLGELDRPYVGSHIIRDPRDMIMSGYFDHLWSDEKWVKQKKPVYQGLSYQEVLNSISQEEGIAMEIGRVKSAIKSMVDWDYYNPNILEIRLEELAADEKDVFRRIFEKYEFNEEQVEIAMGIVEKLSFEKRTGRKKGEEDRKSHLRKGVAGDWKNHFTEDHKKLFKEMYPGVLAKLGYEQDDNW